MKEIIALKKIWTNVIETLNLPQFLEWRYRNNTNLEKIYLPLDNYCEAHENLIYN